MTKINDANTRTRELAAERKRAQRARAASGTPTAEKLRNELFEAFTSAINRHCWDTTQPEPTCNGIIDLVSAKYPITQRGRIAIYFGWPQKELLDEV